MTKISVIMGLYNTPFDYLEACVKSILGQTLKDFELIVIDDGSTIEYADFFKNFNDDRIKYSKLDKNCGPGGARNIGIKQAKGEYIAIVDSDDIYLPNRLELQSQYLDENPNIELLSGEYKQSNNGKISKLPIEHEDIKVFMLFNSPFTSPAVMYRKDAFAKKNLYYPEHIHFGEDYQLWIDAMFADIKMANIKDVVMIYVRRKGQLSKQKGDIQETAIKKLYQSILNKMGLQHTQDELDLHYNIENQRFDSTTIEEIKNWFDKIIDTNKTSKTFNEQKLVAKKGSVIKTFENLKNRLFRLKIGQYNLCINKPFRIYIEERP